MTVFRIEGQWVALRDWRLDDLDTFAYWLHPDHEWHRLDSPYYPGPTIAEIPEWIERKRRWIVEKRALDPRTNIALANAETDQIIGMLSAYWESIETLWMSMGIVIYDDGHWGRGIGFESLGLWTQYQFDARPDIVRLDVRTWSGNRGMMALAQKLGFQEEARFRKARIVEGEHYDSMAYGILRDEWEARHPAGFGRRA